MCKFALTLLQGTLYPAKHKRSTQLKLAQYDRYNSIHDSNGAQYPTITLHI